MIIIESIIIAERVNNNIINMRGKSMELLRSGIQHRFNARCELQLFKIIMFVITSFE